MIDELSSDADIRAIRTLLAAADPASNALAAADLEHLDDLGEELRRRAADNRPSGEAGRAQAKEARELVGWVGRGRRAARKRRLLIGGTLPVVLAVSAAGWAITNRPADQVTGGIGCYAEARLNAEADIVPATSGQPTELCANDWASGPLHARLTNSAEVPPLVACVLPNGGAVGVFPDTTCAALRLQPLPVGYGDAAAKFASLRDDLRDRFAQSRCVSISDGVRLVKTALAEHGFTGWTVKTAQTGTATPCAAFAPDSEHRTITVVGQLSPDLLAVVDNALNSVNGTCRAGTAPTSADAARDAVNEALRRAGYTSWAVTIDAGQTSTAEQPCYSPSFDPRTHRISFSTYTRG